MSARRIRQPELSRLPFPQNRLSALGWAVYGLCSLSVFSCVLLLQVAGSLQAESAWHFLLDKHGFWSPCLGLVWVSKTRLSPLPKHSSSMKYLTTDTPRQPSFSPSRYYFLSSVENKHLLKDTSVLVLLPLFLFRFFFFCSVHYPTPPTYTTYSPW